MAEGKADRMILGEYVIERKLGRGGMGRVWLVKSTSAAEAKGSKGLPLLFQLGKAVTTTYSTFCERGTND